jgi:DNA-binding transcriptional MerR regulator
VSGRLKIGEVHALLRDDFATIELSKIRYYEEKGLVRPARSRKGYRLYSDRDVACLREAIRLAQEEFVPLRVVRQRLIEQGLLDEEAAVAQPRRAANETASNIVAIRVPAAAPTTSDVVAAPHAVTAMPDDVAVPSDMTVGNFGATSTRLSEGELLGASGLNSTQLRELVTYGYLCPRMVAGRIIFDECDLIIAKRYRALAIRGVDIRHLQPLKRIVERQVNLLSDLTSPLRQHGEQKGVNVIDEVRRVHDEIAALRSALLTRALQEHFGH